MTKDYKKLSKYLKYLFWLMIAAIICSLLEGDDVDQNAVETIATVGTLVISVLQLIVMFILGKYNHNYKTAAITYIISSIIPAIGLAFILPGLDLSWNAVGSLIGISTLVLIATLVLGLLYTYFLFKGHREVLEEVGDNLAIKWQKLWKYYLITILALLASTLLLFINFRLGTAALLIVVIALIVVMVYQYIYLFKMIGILENYTPQIIEAEVISETEVNSDTEDKVE